MTRLSVRSLCALSVALAASFVHAQTTITQWNFNSVPADAVNTTGSLMPSIGSGTVAPFNVAPAAPLTDFIFGSGVGSSDTAAADNTGLQTRGYQTPTQAPGLVGAEFSVSTLNFSNVIVTWDQRHSNTSSRFCALYYSTDGVNFTRFPTNFDGNSGDTWFNNRSVDLSAIAGVGSNPSFRFRISPVFDPANNTSYVASATTSTYAGSGTYRFDMVTVSGTALTSIAPSGSGAATPAAVCNAGGQVVLNVTVAPGVNPASTGLSVAADLTSIGGSASVSLLNDGVAPDAVAGDNIFSLAYTVPGSVTPGAKSIPVAIADAQSRSGSASIAFTVADCSANSSSRVVISQIYGGGGNAGPPVGLFNADFIELYNRSNQIVDLTGWSVQYASAAAVAGFSTDRAVLSGVIRPGQSLLVRASAIGTVGQPLPSADFVSEFGIGNSGGRAALVRSSTFIGTNCADTNIEDLVGWGGAVCFEGAAPAGLTSNDTGIVRKLGGAQDTNQSFNDFVVSAPASPRNRASGGFLAGYASIDQTIACAGTGVNLAVSVSPGAAPASTGVQVRADLSQLGGSATQAIADQGGGQFSLAYPVPGSVSQGQKLITLTTTDAQGRTDSSTLTLTVATCVPSASRVVIAGLFTGGGNAGAPWNADHVEIFNRSGQSVDLTGWSLQYASATGTAGFTAAQRVNLSGTINAGEYRLIQTGAASTTSGIPLPTPDFTPATFFGMANDSGRIALVRTIDPLLTVCIRADIEDLVGYGLAALCFEGLSTTVNVSNTTGAYRKLDGCQDTDQSGIDFDVLAPINLPRNSAATVNLCVQPSQVVCCRGVTCTIVASAAACTAPAGVGIRVLPASATSCAGQSAVNAGCCYADFNKSGVKDVADIFAFLSAWFANSPFSDVGGDGTGTRDVSDIFQFLSAWFVGCS